MLNRFDRIISYVAPEAGRRRAIARLRTKEIQKIEMRYDAAAGGRRTADWPAPASNADSALYGAARTLRQMSRDMLRNRPLAVRARDVVAGAVVGTGVLPSVNAPGLTQQQRDLILQVISDHLMSTKLDSLRTSTLPQVQDIIMKAVFSDGEMLVRRRPRTPIYEPDLLVPFQIQLLEIDHLYPTTFDFGGNRVIDGVEYGPTGAIVAYHLLNEHPGALLYTSTWQVTRVPAKDILHIRRLERPEQLRGMPWLAPVMMTLGELSDYQEAQILKQRMAALVAGVLETEPDQAQADTKALSELEPGAIVQAPAGSKITWTTPPKVDDYTPFMSTGIRAVATGLGITYESLSGDLTGVNYSSGRMGHMVMDRNVEMWQQNIVIGQFCRGLERWMKESWAMIQERPGLAGLPDAEQFALDWTAPRRPLIDPVKEIPAMVAEMEAGLVSRQRQQRRLGYDPDTIRRERAEDAERDAAMTGMPEVSNAVAVALANAQNGE